jgi:hypothetical protein
MEMDETIKVAIAQLAQLQVSLIHTETELAKVNDKIKETRYEIRKLIDGEKHQQS